MTECDAETLLCSMLIRDGAQVHRQVALGGKRLDVAASLPLAPGEWVSLEVKLRDWKRAVQQACVNRAFFSRSFIAVPAEVTSRVDEAYLRARGVGLISFDSQDWWIDVDAEPTVVSTSLLASMNERLA